jgi:hypothetical protein
MAAVPALRASLLPLLLLAGGSTSRCELSTDSGTGELHIEGTVKFFESGGCWQIVATDGGRYELDREQAPASVLREGARVSLVVYVNERRGRRCRVGTPVDVWRVVEVRIEGSEAKGA